MASFLYMMFGWIIHIDKIISVLIVAAFVLSFFRLDRFVKHSVRWLFSVVLITVMLPFRTLSLIYLENYYPKLAVLPADVQGIIVLGGSLNYTAYKGRGQACYNSAAGRLLDMLQLTQKYPHLPVVISGQGTHDPHLLAESEQMRDLFKSLNFAKNTLILETKSMNTDENARFSFELVKPKPQEKWVLVTSAVHMPRAVSLFRAAGWTVVPYPVDYHTSGQLGSWWHLSLFQGFQAWRFSMGELLGSLYYFITDRTDRILPDRAVPL